MFIKKLRKFGLLCGMVAAVIAIVVEGHEILSDDGDKKKSDG